MQRWKFNGTEIIQEGSGARIAQMIDGWPKQDIQANARLITKAPAMENALDEILDITHNHGIGISLILGREDGSNRRCFTPEELNRIGDLCRDLLTK